MEPFDTGNMTSPLSAGNTASGHSLAVATGTAAPHPSVLKEGNLSTASISALNDLMRSDHSEMAERVKVALSDNTLRLSSYRQHSGEAQYEGQSGHGYLRIRIQQKETVNYELTYVELRKASGQMTSFAFHAAVSLDRTPCLSLPAPQSDPHVSYPDGLSRTRGRAAEFLIRFHPLIDDPDFIWHDRAEEISAALREHAPFLTPAEAEYIMLSALTEGEYGFSRAFLLGPLISGRSSAEAEDLARRLDGVETQGSTGLLQKQDGRIARTWLLAQILRHTGAAPVSVYAPFVARLSSERYEVSRKSGLPQTLSVALEHMPPDVRNSICSALLAHESAAAIYLSGYETTLQMFRVLRHFSSEMQDAIYRQTISLWEVFPRGSALRKKMTEQFTEVLNVADKNVDGSQPEDINRKWRALFAS